MNYTFPKGTVIPAQDPTNPLANRLFLSPDSMAFRSRSTSPTVGESRFLSGPYSGHLSSFGETIELSNPNAVLVDSLTYEGAPSPVQLNLVISEIMYHPAGDSDAEYIELTNLSETETLDLTGTKFASGITFDFTGAAISSISPGQQILLVKNPTIFEATYGMGLPIAGTYTGSLNNDGETLKLEDATNSTIQEFAFNDASPWPPFSDGQGASLVLINPNANRDPNLATSWCDSSFPQGTPGILPSPGTPPPSNPNADLNNNGQADLLDWALADQATLDTSGDNLTISFKLNLNSKPLTVRIQQSTDLVSWTDTNTELLTQTYNNNGTATYTHQAIASKAEEPIQFLRLVVTAP